MLAGTRQRQRTSQTEADLHVARERNGAIEVVAARSRVRADDIDRLE